MDSQYSPECKNVCRGLSLNISTTMNVALQNYVLKNDLLVCKENICSLVNKSSHTLTTEVLKITLSVHFEHLCVCLMKEKQAYTQPLCKHNEITVIFSPFFLYFNTTCIQVNTKSM